MQIEQNTKEITFFLCIFEMQPIFETSLKDTTNLSRIQIFEIISSYGLIISSFKGSTLFPNIFFFFPFVENDDSHCIQTSFDKFSFPIIYAPSLSNQFGLWQKGLEQICYLTEKTAFSSGQMTTYNVD